MVKIITGYSEKGGSTTAFINLTNLFNEHNIDCTLYGPHQWHLNKCKSGLLQNAFLDTDDIVISHFLKLKRRPNVKTIVLSCHEKWWFDVGGITQYWDSAVFLHKQHREFHSKYKGKYTLIPNFKEDLISKEKPHLDKIAGIIGSIETRKQTHKSIERALNDGCETIYVIGHVGDVSYFNEYVKPKLTNSKIKLIPFQTNKQAMYDMIGRVYHTSKGEVACLVKDECYLTGTKFFGNEETANEVSLLTNEEILNLWKQLLKLK